MMAVLSCLIFCLFLQLLYGLNVYQTGTEQDVIEEANRLLRKNKNPDLAEPTKISARVASLEDEDEKIQFGYDDHIPTVFGPQNWGKISQLCNGNHQSPVNIKSSLLKQIPSPPLLIDGFRSIPSKISAKNNGHSILIKLNFPDDKPIKISGGPLKGSYILNNIHWHWGERDDAGSEHAFNGRKFSAEMHFVSYNSNFSSAPEAIVHPEGLVVFAFIYDLNNSPGATYNPFIPLLSNLIEPDTSYVETKNLFSIRDLIETANFHYVTYEGSLTSPLCNENVTWVVSTRKLHISSEELEQFRKINDESGEPLRTNDRPIQKLNHRDTYYS